MTTYEQIWLTFGTGGAMLFLEETITGILIEVCHKKIPKEWPRAGAGLVLLIFAICKLMNPPS